MAPFYLDPTRVRKELDARRARYSPPLELIDIMGLSALSVSHYLFYPSPGRHARPVDLERLMAIDLKVFALLVNAAPRFAHRAGILPSVDLTYPARIRDEVVAAFLSWYVEDLTPAYSVAKNPTSPLDLGTRAGQLKHHYSRIVAGCNAFDGEASFRTLHDALARSAGEKPQPVSHPSRVNRTERQAMPATMRFLASREGSVTNLLEVTPAGRIAIAPAKALDSAKRVLGEGEPRRKGMRSLDLAVGEDGSGGVVADNEANKNAPTPEQLAIARELRESRDLFDNHPWVRETIDAFLERGDWGGISFFADRVQRLRDMLDETRDPAVQAEIFYRLSRKFGRAQGSRSRQEFADHYGVTVREMRRRGGTVDGLIRRVTA